MKALPNILTIGRLALTLVVLVLLAVAAGAGVQLKPQLSAWAFVAFVVAAITDFFDGWLARRLDATSVLGAILDPIADKTLVAGAIVGLLAMGVPIALPGGLILFREFAVSALRETLAPKGLRLPVTVLAKWKTTVQLIALAALIAVPALTGALSFSDEAARGAFSGQAQAWGLGLIWLAAAITLWTGAEYALSARKALQARP